MGFFNPLHHLVSKNFLKKPFVLCVCCYLLAHLLSSKHHEPDVHFEKINFFFPSAKTTQE